MDTHINQPRPELEPLPERMQGLPIDDRGYPVPWFVAWVDGKPEFRAMDGAKFRAAIRERRCWVCGQRRGVYVCFVVGPMCGINRISSEPPSHAECARWSARNCPFLSNPHMVRREDEVLDNANLQENSAGVALTRNPGVSLLWHTRTFDVIPDGRGKTLILMGDPEEIEFWCKGRLATRAEIDESIRTGLPALQAVAALEKGGLEALQEQKALFERYLP